MAPLATYDNLLNSLLVFSPLHYNRFILHLFTHHLRPLSQVRSSVADVLNGGEVQKGGKKQLPLLTALTILKFHANFDLLSGKSFTDFVQALTSGKVASSEEGGCGLPFEAMLANLLAYSNAQQSKEANSLSLQWLDMLYDLVNSCGQSSPSSSFSSSPPQKQHSFTVVAGKSGHPFLIIIIFANHAFPCVFSFPTKVAERRLVRPHQKGARRLDHSSLRAAEEDGEWEDYHQDKTWCTEANSSAPQAIAFSRQHSRSATPSPRELLNISGMKKHLLF